MSESSLSRVPGVEGWYYGPKRIDRRGVAHVQVFSDDGRDYFDLHVNPRLIDEHAARRIRQLQQQRAAS